MAAFRQESEETMATSEENGSITQRPMRLATIYLMLADGIAQTAEALSEATGSGKRTIYRDIERLRAAGLAVEGTPRLGYTLEAVPELTPLFLTKAERTALVAVAPAGVKTKLRAL
jgi:predicted DNA-binding transcriptional regulator YafY